LGTAASRSTRWSPLHPAQVFCVELHTGVAHGMPPYRGSVHCTHVADVGLHAGVEAVQLASLAAPLARARKSAACHAKSWIRHGARRDGHDAGAAWKGWPFDNLRLAYPRAPRGRCTSLPAPHSASVKHALPHVPVVVLQYGLVAELQSDEVAQATHVPAPASAVTHTPAVAVGHAWVAADAKFPLHGAHRLVVGSHIGCVAGQSPSRTQPPQLLAAITKECRPGLRSRHRSLPSQSPPPRRWPRTQPLGHWRSGSSHSPPAAALTVQVPLVASTSTYPPAPPPPGPSGSVPPDPPWPPFALA